MSNFWEYKPSVSIVNKNSKCATTCSERGCAQGRSEPCQKDSMCLVRIHILFWTEDVL